MYLVVNTFNPNGNYIVSSHKSFDGALRSAKSERKSGGYVTIFEGQGKKGDYVDRDDLEPLDMDLLDMDDARYCAVK